MTTKENYSHFPRLLNLVQSKTTKLHFVRASQVRQSSLFSTFCNILHVDVSQKCANKFENSILEFKISNFQIYGGFPTYVTKMAEVYFF